MCTSEHSTSRLNPSFNKEYGHKDYLDYYLTKRKRLRLSECTFRTIYHYVFNYNYSNRSRHKQRTNDRSMSDDTCTSYSRPQITLGAQLHDYLPYRINSHTTTDQTPPPNCIVRFYSLRTRRYFCDQRTICTLSSEFGVLIPQILHFVSRRQNKIQ